MEENIWSRTYDPGNKERKKWENPFVSEKAEGMALEPKKETSVLKLIPLRA